MAITGAIFAVRPEKKRGVGPFCGKEGKGGRRSRRGLFHTNQRFSLSLSLSQSTAEPCICGQEKMHPWHKKTHEQHDSLWESLAVTSPSVLLVKVVE